MIKFELVSIETSDHLTLPALWHHSNKQRAVVFLHGCGSSSVFYKDLKMNIMAEEFSQVGYSFFAFNNRGAHYIKKFSYLDDQGEKQDSFQGTSVEVIKETIYDLDTVIDWLLKKGITEMVLLGESTGANKICVYDHYRPNNPVLAYALVGGGDDTGLWYQMLGEEKYYHTLKEAQKQIQAGNGLQLWSTELNHQLMTWRALEDVLNPEGDYNCFPYLEYFNSDINLSKNKDLFSYFKGLAKPTLVLYGAEDIFTSKPPREAVKILKKIHPQPELLTCQVVPEAEHSFKGHESLEAQAVSDWLKKL